jgi:hypothetical protein
VKNYRVFQGVAPAEAWQWLDETLPPAKKA